MNLIYEFILETLRRLIVKGKEYEKLKLKLNQSPVVFHQNKGFGFNVWESFKTAINISIVILQLK